jgi:signal transduction histidine kinase
MAAGPGVTEIRLGERAGLHHALARVYDRVGANVVWLLIGLNVLLISATGFLGLWTLARYLGLPLARLSLVLFAGVPLVIVCALLGLLLSRRDLRAFMAWRDDRRSPAQAPAAFAAILRWPVIVTRCGAVGVVASLPSQAYVVVHFHEPWWLALIFACSLATIVGPAWVLCVFTGELGLRPMLAEVTANLPPTFHAPPRGLPVGAKVLGALLIVTAYGTLVTGGFTDLVAPGPSRFAAAMGLELVGLVGASIIFAMVMRSLLDPIRELIRATERVSRGDLQTPVPIIGTDELGRLSHRFNEMLAGLRERETLRDELEASRARIVAAADAERRRVERDLHDGAQQRLVLVRLKLGLLARSLGHEAEAAAAVDELQTEVDAALTELRDLAHGIYPLSLESEGLAGALREAVARSPLPASLSCESPGRCSPELEAAVYFCVLEALQNAAKHAGEDAHIDVHVAQQNGTLTFRVRDTGCGFDPASSAVSAGLQNMTDRIGALGGEFTLTSAPGRGTTVSGSLPFRA